MNKRRSAVAGHDEQRAKVGAVGAVVAVVLALAGGSAFFLQTGQQQRPVTTAQQEPASQPKETGTATPVTTKEKSPETMPAPTLVKEEPKPDPKAKPKPPPFDPPPKPPQ